MKVTVQDVETLKSIVPSQLASYLQAHGWYEDRPFLDNATIWLKKGDDAHEEEILLPKKANLGDYAARISEALSTLEVVEKRSQLDILSDLLTDAKNIEIQGIVTEIPLENSAGTVTLMGIVVGKLRKINFQLNLSDYPLIIKAYQERLPVVCMGDLVKEECEFVLKNLRYFRLDGSC